MKDGPSIAKASVCLLNAIWLFLIFASNTTLYRWPHSNAIDPLEEVFQLRHFLHGEATPLPVFNPRPCLDISHTVFAFASPCQVLSWLSCKLAGEMAFENTVNTECLGSISGNCV